MTDAAPVELEVGGRAVRLTNLSKVLWPAVGFTKGQMVDYYTDVAPVLLPHLAGRPLTLARFPDGVDGPGWFQTTCPHPPAWMRTFPVPSARGRGAGRDYCLVDDLAALLWVANLGAVELHPLLSRAPRLAQPTSVVFDLDPGAPAGLLEAAAVALLVRDVLAESGLDSAAKTSGAAGIHVHVPLNGAADYEETKPFARSVARRLADAHPGVVVDRMDRARRAGKVFVDWSQNSSSKSTAGVYSLRAQTIPLVSTPVPWDELRAAVAAGDVRRLLFTPAAVRNRIERHGDLYAPVLEQHQSLPAAPDGEATGGT